MSIQLFATIGPEDPAEVPALSASPVEPRGLPVCQCTPSWDLCASNKKCIVGKIPCVRTAFLCGLTMTYACTGICIG
ncbi:MAG: bacteriocin fulvocin C-related protein [Byssovorax sp.]